MKKKNEERKKERTRLIYFDKSYNNQSDLRKNNMYYFNLSNIIFTYMFNYNFIFMCKNSLKKQNKEECCNYRFI